MNCGCEAKGSPRGRAFVGFVHVLMAFQQVLSAYYFLTAFEPSPKLVGEGRPFCVLIWSAILSCGAYLCAAGLYLGGICVEGSEESSSTTTSTERTDANFNGTSSRAMYESTSTSVAMNQFVPSSISIDL